MSKPFNAFYADDPKVPKVRRAFVPTSGPLSPLAQISSASTSSVGRESMFSMIRMQARPFRIAR